MENRKAPSPYDKINAKLVTVMYHETKWLNKITQDFTNRMSFFMKYAEERSDYDKNPLEMEIGRVFNLVKSRIEGEFADNRIRTMCIYENKNRGATVPGVNNSELFRIVFSKGNIKDVFINEKTDAYTTNFIENIIDQIEQLISRNAQNR
jgi:hypothetical protein